MGDYKDEKGTTRVGDFLRGLGDVGKPILQAAAGLTGQGWLNNVASAITTSKELDQEKKALAIELFKQDTQDRQNARNSNVAIQESQSSSYLAKNAIYFISLSLMVLLIGIVVALFTIDIPENNENTLYMVLGLVVGYVGAMITFFFGSSEGSKAKTQSLIDKIKK